MQRNEETDLALLEGVSNGRLTAHFEGLILSPEEHEDIFMTDCDCWESIVYTVPS